MSALSVLYLILPFPIAFVLHEAESMGTVCRWLSSKGEAITGRFPKAGPVIARLSSMNKAAFGIASLERLLIVVLVTLCLLSDLPFAREVWFAMFLAFGLRVFVLLAQAIILRGYVPGLVSAVVLIPYICMGVGSISLALPVWEMLLLAFAGYAIAVINCGLAQRLGQAVSKAFKRG